MWWKKWIRMSKMWMPPEVVSAQRAALTECTAQFDFGMRHRLQSKSPRILCESTKRGEFDMSIPIFKGKPLYDINQSTSDKEFIKKGGFTFFGVESSERFNKVYRRIIASLCPHMTTSDLLREPPQLITAQVSGKYANNWGAIFMINTNSGLGSKLTLSAAHSLCHISTVDTRIIELRRSSTNPLFPTNSTWHQSVLDVYRMPYKGKLLTLFNNLKKYGFINYYGIEQQHYNNVPAILPAAAMLARDFKRCSELYALNGALAGRRPRDIHAAWKRGRLEMDNDAFRKLCTSGSNDGRPHYFFYSLMSTIGEKPNWKHCASDRPPEVCAQGLRMFQEMIYNYMTSVRIASGLRVIVGDLVRQEGTDLVEYVTTENINSYSVYDVVLPVLTFPYIREKVKFPKHDINESFVSELLSDYGIHLEAVCVVFFFYFERINLPFFFFAFNKYCKNEKECWQHT